MGRSCESSVVNVIFQCHQLTTKPWSSTVNYLLLMFQCHQWTTKPWGWVVNYLLLMCQSPVNNQAMELNWLSCCYVSVSPVNNQAMELNCESPINAMDMNKDMTQVVVAGRQGSLWVHALCVCMCECVCVCMCVWVCMCVSVCVCIFVCMCVCVCVCACMCLYACTWMDAEVDVCGFAYFCVWVLLWRHFSCEYLSEIIVNI